MSDNNYCGVIGIDIGRTKIGGGVVLPSGVVEYGPTTRFTNLAGGGQAVINQCREIVQELIAASPVSPAAIGIGAPGTIDHQNGIIVRGNTMPDWENIPIRAIFEQEFHLPVAVDNDVFAGALAEYHFGAACAAKSFVYMVIGTGVGIAAVKDGQVWRGSHGLAGHIAQLPLFGMGKTVNQAFSGQGIAEQAAGHGLSPITGDVFRLARDGHVIAQSIVGEALEGAALTLAWAHQMFDPDLFVLGGSVALGQSEFVQQIKRRVQEILGRYMMLVPQGIEIVPAALGNDSGIVEAAVLGFDLLGG